MCYVRDPIQVALPTKVRYIIYVYSSHYEWHALLVYCSNITAKPTDWLFAGLELCICWVGAKAGQTIQLKCAPIKSFADHMINDYWQCFKMLAKCMGYSQQL